MIGQRFGQWVVISNAPRNKDGRKAWFCRCDCGTERAVVQRSLTRRLSESCGCLGREIRKFLGIGVIHGHTSSKANPSPTYISWSSMKMRCLKSNHRNFKNYGGKGIKICARWMNFANFLADMGERPAGKTIDRLDNDKDYEPSNCRWATWKEQAANRRRPNMKPRISYTDLAWTTAFTRIQEGQRLLAAGVEYCVAWKHEDPDWCQLSFRAEKKKQTRMIRKGDPLLLELHPQ